MPIKIANIRTRNTAIEIYVVLTYALAFERSFRAMASANLLRNPCPSPMSKKLTHAIIELMVK